MHKLTIVQDSGEKHVLVEKGSSEQKGSMKIGRNTFGITTKRCSLEQSVTAIHERPCLMKADQTNQNNPVEVKYDGSAGTLSVKQVTR